MTKLEVQYAVRFPDLRPGASRTGWRVLPGRYGPRDRVEAERCAAGCGAAGEVVARVVVVAGDWTDPDTAEGVVRDHEDRERRHETVDLDLELDPFVLRRRSPEDRRAYLAAKRAEWVAAGKDTAGLDLIDQLTEEPDGLVGFDWVASAEQVAEFKRRWREVHGGGRGRAYVIESGEPRLIDSSHRPEPTPEGRLYCAACGRMIVNSNGVTASGADACEGWRSDRG